MWMGQAVEYRRTRERVRWMTGVRLRCTERRGRRRARAGRLDAAATVRLAAIRDQLAARGQQLQPVPRRRP